MAAVITVSWLSIVISVFWAALFMPEILNAKSRK
jgi:hypothetical protein